jgi:hypothetical protein
MITPIRSPFDHGGAHMLRQRSFTVLLLVALASPALAAGPASPDQPSDLENPAEVLRRATEMIMQAIDLLVANVPQYEAPKLLPNGDIIIRRKHPHPAKPAPGSPSEDRT